MVNRNTSQAEAYPAEIGRQLAELTTLYEVSAAIMADLDQTVVLQTIAQEMVRVLPVDGCTVFLYDEKRGQLQPAARHASRSEGAETLAPDSALLHELAALPLINPLFERQETYYLCQDDPPGKVEKVWLQAAGLKAVLLVPLIWRNQRVGLLALDQRMEIRGFTSQEIQLVRSLAGQATVAIEHADLFSKAQRRIGELAAFHEIALQINSPLDLKTVLDTITESALKLIEANNAHIYLYDPEKQSFTFGSALWRDGRRVAAVSTPRSDGFTASVVRDGRPVIIGDAASHPLYQSADAKAWGVGAIAGFPFKRVDRVFGVFTLTYLEAHAFTDDELLLLHLLADEAAVAVENARLYTDAQRRLRGMSALVDMAQQVTGNLKLESVVQTTVQIIQGLLNARASTIALLSDDGQELVIEAAAGINPKWVHRARMRLGEGVSGQAVSERRPVYIRDTRKQPDFLFFDNVLRSLLAVPLLSRDVVIGTITVDSDRPNAFNQSDIQLLTIAAAQVSVAIVNARLFQEADERAAKLAVAYSELQESDRLKDELVQNVSHELRTPLTFVKGYVDLLLDGEMGLINPDQQHALQIVGDKTAEITRLIDDIMSLQRIESTNLILESFSMDHLVEEAVSCHRLSADNHGIFLSWQGPGTAVTVTADRGRLNQVFDNLIGNALKFSPNGGTILVNLVEEADTIRVSVSDQGIGVPVDKLDRIFERFYQVDGSARRRFGGTGIGLAIVKRIIDAHRGRIWVESEVNKGSTFYFTLPKAPQVIP